MPLEETTCFEGSSGSLFGILHLPDKVENIKACLLMVVGGPQTRVGSHRSYTLIARELCRRGIPVFRFDYTGIGDSGGQYIGFTDAGPSIKSAVDWLYQRFPHLEKVIPWSLCDGSAACALFVPDLGNRTPAMILCNPYVHSQQSQAKTFLKYYYLTRILDAAFWKKVFSLQVNPFKVFLSISDLIQKTRNPSPNPNPSQNPKEIGVTRTVGNPSIDPPDLPEKVMAGLKNYTGGLFLLMSTNDLTAKEFLDLYKLHSTKSGRPLRATLRQIEGADHTFSSQENKLKVCDLTVEAWQSLA